MILIADSGSTKTEWIIVSEKQIHERVFTSGINPFYQDAENIAQILLKEYSSKLKQFDAIYFYGAGCINQEKQELVRSSIAQVMSSGSIFVGSDLLAAARGLCGDQPGIACILGTGSNSCYYNGSEISDHVSPLGFILGDEGSGAVLGKKLVSDILKKQLPSQLIRDFMETYQTTAAEILEHVYKLPFPNRYLANYTRFLSKNIQYPEIEKIVLTGFREFVSRNLLQYTQIRHLPIHFSGSVAYYFEVQLRKVIEEMDLLPGKILQSPGPGLVAYHQEKI